MRFIQISLQSQNIFHFFFSSFLMFYFCIVCTILTFHKPNDESIKQQIRRIEKYNFQLSLCKYDFAKYRKNNYILKTPPTSSASLLISVGKLDVTIRKIFSAESCFRNGSKRARSLLPFETSRKGRNSPPESLH